MALSLYEPHFTGQASPEEARQLFKQSVRLVELEPFTYCNRVCWFCPNSKIDRRSANYHMDEALYLRILDDLAEIGYDKSITYCRYNEPLSDRIILKRIQQAREKLPNAHLFTHTNGDYLTKAYLNELRDAGLNQLKVQVYLGANDRFNDEAVLERMHKRLNDLGLPYRFFDTNPGIRYAAHVQYEGVTVTFESINYDSFANDRGQSIEVPERPKRTSPCLMVFTDMYVDYDGSVMPCCNLRSDVPDHKNYIVSKLSAETSIFDAYINKSISRWRKSLLHYGEKQGACSTCIHAQQPDSPEIRQQFNAVAEQFGVLPQEFLQAAP